METTIRRPLGVMLISALYVVKSIVMTVIVIVAFLQPDSAQSAYKLAAQLAPLLQLFHSARAMIVAPVFVVLGIVIATGVWNLRGWAWGLLVVMCGIPLVRLAQFLAIGIFVDHALLSLLPSSPFFVVDVVTSLFIVNYLLREDTKRVFGDRS